ncbi:sulfotransferase-like domain-containing protein [Roseivivax sediminis]|uniref:sulfotransferase-like domain-containing protein n=1 Tax=Roseivivax sediminis TaxID=936889 RepID=UPI00122C9B5A|nr:HAD family hydrolase [Roseivivax sediminis]
MRIEMWSGPRNLSTAMMYAFGNRADMHVVDEPFYAAYLAETGYAHPMRQEILAAQPQDPDAVIDQLTAPAPDGSPHRYHKHMAQHMTPSVPRDWIAGGVNVFLLRHPARVVASFGAKYPDPALADIGFAQQAELHDRLIGAGGAPVVIDSHDIRAAPELMLRRLCEAIGLAFDPAMLAWPAGGHANDGVWAPVWYGSVHSSTGFAGPEGPLPELDGAGAELADAAMPAYRYLAAKKI